MSRKNNKRIRYSKKKKKYSIPKQRMQKHEKLTERIIVVGTFEKSRNFGFVVPDGRKKGGYRCIYIKKIYKRSQKRR